MTKKAMQIAFATHINQQDKSKVAYVFHPYHLAEQMSDEVSICVALLHDVVEDSETTFDDLSEKGISEQVVDAIKLMTHDHSVDYMEYVQNIKDSGNECAIRVKLADLKHNSDLSRISDIKEEDLERLEKYKDAIALLEA